MQIAPGEIHIWSTTLVLNQAQEQFGLALLSPDEQARAARLVRPTISQRFIIARSFLRQILSLYVGKPASEISFSYNEYNKPGINYPLRTNVQFNLSHSDDRLIIALTVDYAIGVDIEKIKETFNPAIVKRFFSEQEQQALETAADPATFFYQIWSRKEAVLKALGKGLFAPPANFSVADEQQVITLEKADWSVLSLPIHEHYAAALASDQVITNISYWQLAEKGPVLEHSKTVR